MEWEQGERDGKRQAPGQYGPALSLVRECWKLQEPLTRSGMGPEGEAMLGDQLSDSMNLFPPPANKGAGSC